MAYKSYRSQSSGAPAWFWQRVTGIVLVVVLLGHYFLMHSTPQAGHTYDAVLARMQSPWWKAIDLTFVVFGLYHGLQGIWNIIRDFTLGHGARLLALVILLLLGVGFGVMGFATILSF